LIDPEWRYPHPRTRERADLVATIANELIVFELKCFVNGADANKMQKWPEQLSRLVKVIENGDARKGVAVCTFQGYGNSRVATFAKRFHPDPWNTAGPRKFFGHAPLQLVVATIANQNLRC
jgi:hypothetical protein